MPLVIIVLAIIVAIISFKESLKRDELSKRSNDKYYSNVNPVFENIALCKHIYDEGCDFDTAFGMAVKDTVDAGYVPCISKEFYQKQVKQHYEDKFYNYAPCILSEIGRSTCCPYEYFFADDENLINKVCKESYIYDCRRHAIEICKKSEDTSHRKITPYQYTKTLDDVIKAINRSNSNFKEDEIARVKNNPDYFKKVSYWDFDDLIYPKNPDSNFEKSMILKALHEAAFAEPKGRICQHPRFGVCEVVGRQITSGTLMYEIKEIKTGETHSVSSKDKDILWMR